MQGFVFSSENLAEQWARLDEFEGEGYERVLTTVKLKDGNVVDAYIYKLRNSDSPHNSVNLLPLCGRRFTEPHEGTQ